MKIIAKKIIIRLLIICDDFFHSLKLHCQNQRLEKFKKTLKKVGDNVVIEYPYNITCQENIEIGERTTILAHSRINLYEKNNIIPKVKIGKNCYIGFFFSLLAGDDIEIEDDVLVASNVLISSENHSINPEDEKSYMDQDLLVSPVRIGQGTWIGEKVIILPGVTIGKKCVVGAGSIVTKSIPDYSIAVGNPARIIKKYDFNKHDWIVLGEEKK